MPPLSPRAASLAAAALAAGLLAPAPAHAVGCVRATCAMDLDAPSYHLAPGAWRLNQGVRYFSSHRHFKGAVEQTAREAEHSEVINTVGFYDAGLTYGLTDRFSLYVGGPLQLATRSSPVRDQNRQVIDRDVVSANGLGDFILGARGWVLDPAAHQPYNLELGLGVKLPTGAFGLTGVRRSLDSATGQLTSETQTIDQSIQPGDGSVGVMLQASGFWQLAPSTAAYLDGSYLLNPMDTNGVQTFRSRPSEAIMSIADQYLVRLGATTGFDGLPGLGLSLGGRVDGVPVYDVLGNSNGFRRPGVSISLDPGLSYSWGGSSLSLNVPIALYRNRLQSVTDLQDNTHGDAAFADYLVVLGYSHTFGPAAPAP